MSFKTLKSLLAIVEDKVGPSTYTYTHIHRGKLQTGDCVYQDVFCCYVSFINCYWIP